MITDRKFSMGLFSIDDLKEEPEMRTIEKFECDTVTGGSSSVIVSHPKPTQDGGVYIAPYGKGGGSIGGVGGGGGTAANVTKAAVGVVTLMTGLVTGNPVRVATSSFTIGYSVANALGAEALGRKVGGAIYNVSH